MNNFDATDLRLLDALQHDASLSNKELAAKTHLSEATCLRRVRRLKQLGVIERQIAILSPEKLGSTLLAIVEITLDDQAAKQLYDYEAFVTADGAVQQCYRVSAGADFVLILQIASMDAYHQTAHRLFSAHANVRNVRTFFSIHRAKCSLHLSLPAHSKP
jgi:Lrp/AsnC family leucine-responsive transcriptional regulator